MRAIIAARLSQLQKDGRAGIGLDTQDTRSQAWAEREGHEVVTDPIADAKSGTVAPMDRPNLRPWVTDPARMAQYDGIIAYKNDRLSRGVCADELRIKLWAEEHGKTLLIVDGPQWPPRHDCDKWSWEANATQARKEWEDGRERSRRSQLELMQRGTLVGKPPWGLASTGPKYDRRAVPTPAGEKYIPEVFTRIADDQTLTEVAAWLSAATGRAWHPRTIAKMIRNTAYRGQYQMAGGKYVHQCPPLVDGDLWRRANANLDARPSGRRGQRSDLAAGAALLSGIVTCGNPECTAGPDSPMYKIRAGGARTVTSTNPRTGAKVKTRVPAKAIYYYRCSGRGPVREGCGTMVPLIAADALMDRVMGQLRRQVLRPVFHGAEGHQVELDDIAQQLRDLPARELAEDAEDAERARLRAARRELAGLPTKPAWTEYVPVPDAAGQPLTYGARWAQAGQAERREWLRAAAFSVRLVRPAMLAYKGGEDDGDDGAEDDGDFAELATVDVYTSDDAALVFEWADDSDPGLDRGLI